MLFAPEKTDKKEGCFIFGAKTVAVANACLDKPVFREIWNGFCCHSGDISFVEDAEYVFKVGACERLPVPKEGFLLKITENGISASASTKNNLIYAFYTILELITPVCTKKGAERFEVPCCEMSDKPEISTRMVHFCVFPETKLFFIKKFLRTAAFLRFTHVIVEFWGTISLDCLKELSWKNSFTKEDIRPLIAEARDMGLEIVPMFNHWGHASGCRVAYGKHVVLDQNLALAPLFDISGWNWNIMNPEVRRLHTKVRNELMDLCGDGEYFHIGCDEPYGHFSDEYYELVADYVNGLARELAEKGRKAIMWGDMLLHNDVIDKKTNNSYSTFSPSAKIQQILLNKLSRSIVIGDWEYSATHFPIETAVYLKENGFETICCPWDTSYENVIANVKTVKEYDLKGFMHTTWQSVASGFHCLAFAAITAWKKRADVPEQVYYDLYAYLANVMRKLCFANGEYRSCGWTEKQILEKLH